MRQGQTLDSAFSATDLDARDRAFAVNIAATTLRRFPTLLAAIKSCLDKGIPDRSGLFEAYLLTGACQLLFLDVPDHAAVDCAVRLIDKDRHARRYRGVGNAVLRRVSRDPDGFRQPSATGDAPRWLFRRWEETYGADVAHAIAAAHRRGAALDITVKSDPGLWAERLEGVVLPTGSIRRTGSGRIEELPGFDDGAWWIQDAAAALPARLLGDVSGRRVADFCAAPGGKTAQLVAAGGRVTAIDIDETRLKTVATNLKRLGLDADLVTADATSWTPAEPFDAVLVDAPCSATGTIRRHPDIPWLRSPDTITALVQLQARLLDQAAKTLKPGGKLVYATCSLEPEEGEHQAAGFLDRHPEFARVPVEAAEIEGLAEAVTPEGDLRTLPCHIRLEDARISGLDGFFAARFERRR